LLNPPPKNAPVCQRRGAAGLVFHNQQRDTKRIVLFTAARRDFAVHLFAWTEVFPEAGNLYRSVGRREFQIGRPDVQGGSEESPRILSTPQVVYLSAVFVK
jgi:hypothetical protein